MLLVAVWNMRSHPKWSVKVEYQFIDLGDQHLSNVGSDGYADHARVDDSFSTVRLGLNYHFQQESVASEMTRPVWSSHQIMSAPFDGYASALADGDALADRQSLGALHELVVLEHIARDG